MHYSLDNIIPAFYSKSLKTILHGIRTRKICDFFMPVWRMRTENILNIGQSFLCSMAFSESATSQFCVAFLRKILQ